MTLQVHFIFCFENMLLFFINNCKKIIKIISMFYEDKKYKMKKMQLTDNSKNISMKLFL